MGGLGGIDPVFNTGPEPSDWGVHVHARARPSGHKVIDQTYASVVLGGRCGDRATLGARRHSLSRAHRSRVKRCFALTVRSTLEQRISLPRRTDSIMQPRRRHFSTGWRAVDLQSLADIAASPEPSRATDSVASGAQSRTSDFAGASRSGDRISAALDRSRPEESGVHGMLVCDGRSRLDDTFGSISVDGLLLDPDQVEC